MSMTDKQPTAEEILRKHYINMILNNPDEEFVEWGDPEYKSAIDMILAAMSEYKSLPVDSAGLYCPDCGGTGVTINYIAACCRNPDEDGNCCNCPIAEPIQEQCCRCEATGYLKTENPHSTQQVVDVGKVAE